MSITRHASEFDEVAMTFGLSAAGQPCFYCGELLTDPAVMWWGMPDNFIYLHADCALDLAGGLIDDSAKLT